MVKSAHDRQIFPHLKIYAPVADSPRTQGECTPTCPDFPKPRTSEEPAMFTPGNIVPLLLRQKKTPAGLRPFHLGFFKGAVDVPLLPQFSHWAFLKGLLLYPSFHSSANDQAQRQKIVQVSASIMPKQASTECAGGKQAQLRMLGLTWMTDGVIHMRWSHPYVIHSPM